jgi:hypothetical protein
VSGLSPSETRSDAAHDVVDWVNAHRRARPHGGLNVERWLRLRRHDPEVAMFAGATVSEPAGVNTNDASCQPLRKM